MSNTERTHRSPSPDRNQENRPKKVPQSFDEWWEQIGKIVYTEDEKPACRAAWGGCTNATLAARGVYL